MRPAGAAGIPLRAVVADSFDGETETFRTGLVQQGLGDVLALKPSPAWWAPVGTVTSLAVVARTAAGEGAAAPGAGQPVARTVCDGHRERWGALAVQIGPSGPTKRERAVIATTDPATVPDPTTW